MVAACRSMVVTLIASTISAGLAQTIPSGVPEVGVSPVRVLTSSKRVNLHIPMFSAVGRVNCDASENVVFDVGSGVKDDGPLLWVGARGDSHRVLSIPGGILEYRSMVWTVTSAGLVYVLLHNFKEYKLVRLKQDGAVDETLDLPIPPRVNVLSVAITDNETILVKGFHDSSEDPKTPRLGYAAILDASGRLVRDLSTQSPQFDINAASRGPVDGDAIAGGDGRFYLLGRERILVLNQIGEVVNRLELPSLATNEHAVRVDASNGRISVLLHSVNSPKGGQLGVVRVRCIVLNAQTGDLLGDYQFSPETTGTVLCFDSQTGYTLLAVDGEMAAEDIVPLR